LSHRRDDPKKNSGGLCLPIYITLIEIFYAQGDVHPFWSCFFSRKVSCYVVQAVLSGDHPTEERDLLGPSGARSVNLRARGPRTAGPKNPL